MANGEQGQRPLRSVGAPGLVLAFGCAILAFVASTVYAQIASRRIDESALEIADDAAPGVAHLATVRAEASRLDALLSGSRGTSPSREQEVRELVVAIEGAIGSYFALPLCDEERAILDRDTAFSLVAEIRRITSAIVAAHERGEPEEVARALERELRPVLERLVRAATALIRFDANRAHDLALEIHALRRRSMLLAYALDAASAALSAVAAIIAVRIARHHARVVDEHARLLEVRAAELELFAGRVAHDVLSPLQATKMALSIARSRSSEPELRRALDRGDAGVARVARVVDGLLGFARAGASPSPDARAEVRPVLEEIASELRPRAEEAAIRLSIDAPPSLVVACDGAILSVVIGNLAQNAVKYMGDAVDRAIVLRASPHGAAVRVEVEDTGPGLPPGLGDRVFEPYVRGRGRAEPGIGLGLATVKRIAEAHGGRVGLRSAPGAGSSFWVDLPRADAQNAMPE